MSYTRSPLSASPVSLDDAKGYIRVSGDDEDLLIQRLVLAAAREIEAYCDLALTTQTIAFVGMAQDGILTLPVGPLAQDHALTVNGVPVSTGISGGRYPSIALPNVTGYVGVTYTAGYGDTAASVPDDLAFAVLEQLAWHYDNRGEVETKPGLTPAAARIAARYRKVRV